MCCEGKGDAEGIKAKGGADGGIGRGGEDCGGIDLESFDLTFRIYDWLETYCHC